MKWEAWSRLGSDEGGQRRIVARCKGGQVILFWNSNGGRGPGVQRGATVGRVVPDAATALYGAVLCCAALTVFDDR